MACWRNAPGQQLSERRWVCIDTLTLALSVKYETSLGSGSSCWCPGPAVEGLTAQVGPSTVWAFSISLGWAAHRYWQTLYTDQVGAYRAPHTPRAVRAGPVRCGLPPFSIFLFFFVSYFLFLFFLFSFFCFLFSFFFRFFCFLFLLLFFRFEK
jgi:hypothetical protein